MTLEKFNKQNHAVSGCIGTKFYMMYTLREVIKLYNAEARKARN